MVLLFMLLLVLICCVLPVEVLGYNPLPNGNGCCNYNPGLCDPCDDTDSLGGIILDWIAGGDKKAVVQNKYGDIADWDVHQVTSMDGVFSGKFGSQTLLGRVNISAWDVSRVTTMRFMFCGASDFNSDLSTWNVGNVNSMFYMFTSAGSLRSDSNLTNWDVSKVQTMENMFFGTEFFNSDLSKWDVGNVQSMREMFGDANSFNSDLPWDVSSVTTMLGMFSADMGSAFNGDISSWNVEKVTDQYGMTGMFSGANQFNGDLSKWNVANVVDMTQVRFLLVPIVES